MSRSVRDPAWWTARIPATVRAWDEMAPCETETAVPLDMHHSRALQTQKKVKRDYPPR